MEVQEEPRREYVEFLGHTIYRTIERGEWPEWVITIDANWLPHPYRAYMMEDENFGADLVERMTNSLMKRVLFDQVRMCHNG